LLERRTVWRRHAALVLESAVPKMRVHELRKTMAWYSRGLHGGARLRQESFTSVEPEQLVAWGERFFDELQAAEARSGESVLTVPADPVAKAIARKTRRNGPDQIEADECRA
jgi:hypothetical protein